MDPAADTDHSLLGRRGTVELLLHTDQRSPQDLAQLGAQLRTGIRLPADLQQDVVDGLAVPQPLHRIGQIRVPEPAHDGLLKDELLLPDPGLRSNAALVGLRLLGEPCFETPGLFSQFRIQARALSREIPLQARHMLLPLPGELGLRGVEVLVGTP